jgi:hypothetical protein
MVVHRAVEAFRLVTGHRPHPDHMFAGFLDLTGGELTGGELTGGELTGGELTGGELGGG